MPEPEQKLMDKFDLIFSLRPTHSFRKIFPDTDEGSFSKRSLTSLTKIALSASGPHTDIPI